MVVRMAQTWQCEQWGKNVACSHVRSWLGDLAWTAELLDNKMGWWMNNLDGQGSHDGVVTCLEPDILECEVKWASGSITMNKGSEGDRIPADLFQILKEMLLKCCTQYASKFGKLNNGHRTRKGQFSFQSQKKVMPKNVQITTQLHLSHTLVK